MTSKKIASEIAIGLILLIAVIVGGMFWLQNRKMDQEDLTISKQPQQSPKTQEAPRQDNVSNEVPQTENDTTIGTSDETAPNSFLQKCLEDDGCLHVKEINKIVKVSSTDNSESLVISNSDGSDAQILVERKFEQFDGRVMDIIGYSDGGKYVYYSPEQPDGLGGAYIFGGVYGGMNKINVKTKKIETILTTENTGAIYNVSRDGKWVAYETYAGGNIPYYYPRLNKKPVDFNGLILKKINNEEDRKIVHRNGYIRFGNSIFSPNSLKVAYEEEKGENPDARQYDAVVENVNDGSERAIFENCSLAASEWEKNKNSWVDNRYLLITCSDKNYYRIDTASGNKKEKIVPTPEMQKWNVSGWTNVNWGN